MSRPSESPLKVKENESGCPGEKQEASFPLPKKQKICKVTKSKAIRASKKENLSDGNQARSQKRALTFPEGLGEGLPQPEGHPGDWQCPGGCSGALQGEVGSEPPLPLNGKENISGSRSGSLGTDFYSTPEGGRAEGKPDLGISEELRKKPVDFATVTIADFGIAPGSFTKGCKGNSPTSLKFRRRSTIGLRGSPENNSLIRYLAQQRSNRQKAAFTEISPFKYANVRPLKDKIEAFQTSFESLQEAEEKTEPLGLSHVDDASQERGSCKLIKCSAQNKIPLKNEPTVEQWSERFVLDNSGADWTENVSANVTKSDPRTCSILSPHRGVTEPAAPKEWVYEQNNLTESLETVVTGDILETGHVSRSDHSTADTRRDVLSDPSRRKVGLVKELSLGMFDESKALDTPPVTPRQSGTIPLNDLTQSGSLRSILKKTPKKQLMDSPKEYLSDAVDGGGGESVPVFSFEKAFEAPETESTESLNFKTPKKKKVTFGEVLSPEIFDQTLPANTPLRRGASPGCALALSSSPPARPQLTAEPVPRLHLDWEDECAETLQELLEDPAASEDPSPVENAEAQTDKPDMAQTLFSTKRKRSGRDQARLDCHASWPVVGFPKATVSVPPQPPLLSPQHGAPAQQPHCSPSGATSSTGSAQGTQNPRRNKVQRQKNPSTSAPRKTQKMRHRGYGKRRKRKVKKSLYGEREMASKKPLLSPIPEIPEVLSSVSTPDSSKADPLFSEDEVSDDPKSRNASKGVQEKAVVEGMRGQNIHAVDVYPSPEDLDVAAPGSSRAGTFQESGAGTSHEFSNIVPDAEGGFDTSEYFQQGKESASENEAKESSSLMENELLQENPLPGLEFLEQQAQDVHEGAQGTWRPQAESVKGSPARKRRRRSSGAIYFPPVEKLEITGIDLPVSSYNVEEVLSVPEGSFQRFRRKSSIGGETRVRRSMRLSKDAGSEGLAWISLPGEIPKEPPPPQSAPKSRRRTSTSILTGSENIHPREQNPILFSALGKENEDSAHLADGPCRRWRRQSAATPQKTPKKTKKRRITNSVNKDRNNQKHPEEAEMPLEVTPGDVSAISDFLK